MKYTGKLNCNNSYGSPIRHTGDSFFELLMVAIKTSKMFVR